MIAYVRDPSLPSLETLRLEALKLSRDIAVGNEPAAITLDRAQQFYEFLTQVGK